MVYLLFLAYSNRSSTEHKTRCDFSKLLINCACVVGVVGVVGDVGVVGANFFLSNLLTIVASHILSADPKSMDILPRIVLHPSAMMSSYTFNRSAKEDTPESSINNVSK